MLKCALLHRFQALIALRTGLTVPERGRGDLRDSLSARMYDLRLSHPADYYSLLELKTEYAEAEWKQLVPLLTNRVYHFFRDTGQLALLKDRILPEIIGRNWQDRTLRIWSAGCSSGEEAYSLAILIHALLPAWRDWKILILATDVDEDALQKGRTGCYPPSAFRMVTPDLWAGYFEETDIGCSMSIEVKRSVTFMHGDLIRDQFADAASEMRNLDLIVCRNVFVWLEREQIGSVLPKLAASLRPGGYLMTGHDELRDQDPGLLQPRLFPEGVIYRRRDETLSANLTPDPWTAPIVAAEWEYLQGNYRESLARLQPLLTSSAPNYTTLYLAALVSQQCGDHEDARRYCSQMLEVDPFAVSPYTLLGRIANDQGCMEEARSFLNRAVYLSPSDIPACLELGEVYQKQGTEAKAQRILRRALELLKEMHPFEPVEPYNDKTAGETVVEIHRRLSKGLVQ